MEIFENGHLSFTRGHLKTELFENDDVTGSNALRVEIFLKNAKKIWAFNRKQIRVDGLKGFKNTSCGRRYFLKKED